MKNIFKWEFTLGTVLQLITMFSLAVGAYYKFDARQTRTEEILIQQKMRVDDHDLTLRELSHNQTRLTTIIEERTKGRL